MKLPPPDARRPNIEDCRAVTEILADARTLLGVVVVDLAKASESLDQLRRRLDGDGSDWLGAKD